MVVMALGAVSVTQAEEPKEMHHSIELRFNLRLLPALALEYEFVATAEASRHVGVAAGGGVLRWELPRDLEVSLEVMARLTTPGVGIAVGGSLLRRFGQRWATGVALGHAVNCGPEVAFVQFIGLVGKVRLTAASTMLGRIGWVMEAGEQIANGVGFGIGWEFE